MRQLKDANEMIDVLSSIRGGQFVTICYVNSAKIGKTLTGKNVNVDQFGIDLDNNRMDGDDEIHDTLKKYQQGGASRTNKFPYRGIVKLTINEYNWQTEQNYNDNFSKYASARDALLAKYGASIEKRGGHDEKLDFGKGGVSVGSTDNTRDRLYTHQNGATARRVGNSPYYFVVDNDGTLKGGISGGAIKQIIAKSGDRDGVAAMRKIGATEEQIKEYEAELKKLNFSVIKMLYSSILFLIATTNDGEKVFFINDKLANTIGSGSYTIEIDPSSFMKTANDLFELANSQLTESVRLYKIMVENRKRVDSIIKESIRKSLQKLI